MIRVTAILLIALVASTVVAAEPAPTSRPAPRVRKLVIAPATQPTPAMKYRLLPPISEQTPGNAATLYLQAGELLQRDEKQPTSAPAAVERHMDSCAGEPPPLSELPKEEVAQYLGTYQSALHLADLAARRETCKWDLPLRQDGIMTLLPHLSRMRQLATLLSLRCRLEMARGEFDRAAYTLQSGFALARHLDREALLIQSMVAAGCAKLFRDRLAEWDALPGAPNLYWALAALPRPFVDYREAMRWERAWLYFSFPELQKAKRGEMTGQDWQVLLGRFRMLAPPEPAATSQPSLGGLKDILEAGAGLWAMHVQATEYLIQRGRTKAEVEAMHPAKAVGLYMVESYEEWSDEMLKWESLPYWQRAAGAAASEKAFMQFEKSGHLNILLMAIPAYRAAGRNAVKLDREMALAVCIEGLRDYAATHGDRLPESLDQLVDTPAPLDPATGKGFEYRREGTGGAIVLPPLLGDERDGGSRWEISVRR